MSMLTETGAVVLGDGVQQGGIDKLLFIVVTMDKYHLATAIGHHLEGFALKSLAGLQNSYTLEQLLYLLGILHNYLVAFGVRQDVVVQLEEMAVLVNNELDLATFHLCLHGFVKFHGNMLATCSFTRLALGIDAALGL